MLVDVHCSCAENICDVIYLARYESVQGLLQSVSRVEEDMFECVVVVSLLRTLILAKKEGPLSGK